jgi:hypothetical protein
MYCSIRTHLRAGSFSPLALLLALVAFGLALGGCGSSGASQDEIEAARKQGAAKAQQQADIHQIKKELQELKKGKSVPGAAQTAAGTGTAPEGSNSSGSGNCGGSLSANSVTTCGFAANVQQAYFEEIGSGSGTVYAYSPTTGQTYSMYCSSGSPHECTGGNDAAVYFP